MNTERERFEAWVKNHCHKYDLGYSFQTLANGEYMGTGTDAMWKQWQHQAAIITDLQQQLTEISEAQGREVGK